MESMVLTVVREFSRDAFLRARAENLTFLIVTKEALPFIGDNLVAVTEPTFVVTNEQYSLITKTWEGTGLFSTLYGSDATSYKLWSYRLMNIAHWYQLSEL